MKEGVEKISTGEKKEKNANDVFLNRLNSILDAIKDFSKIKNACVNGPYNTSAECIADVMCGINYASQSIMRIKGLSENKKELFNELLSEYNNKFEKIDERRREIRIKENSINTNEVPKRREILEEDRDKYREIEDDFKKDLENLKNDILITFPEINKK